MDLKVSQDILLRLLDGLFSCVVIGPLVIYFWQGTWLLMDICIFPDSTLNSALVSTTIGFVFSHLILFMQGRIVKKLSNHEIILDIVWKTCMYMTALSSISFWRGVWILLDWFSGTNLTSFIICHCVSYVILTLTRTTCTIISPPGYVLRDKRVTPISTMNINFTNQPSDLVKTLTSHFLTVTVIGTCVVGYWRGTWMISIYLVQMLLGSGLDSCVAAITFGYVVFMACFGISDPLESKLTGKSLRYWPYSIKAFIEHVFIYILGFGAVNIWNGTWCLGDFYFIQGKENKKLVGLVMHCITVIFLYIGQGAINIVGSPVGCRTHGNNTLEGLYMGTFFRVTQPRVIDRQDIENTPNQASLGVTKDSQEVTQQDGLQNTENETLLGVTTDSQEVTQQDGLQNTENETLLGVTTESQEVTQQDGSQNTENETLLSVTKDLQEVTQQDGSQNTEKKRYLV